VVEREVVARLPPGALSAYVVWTPILDGDDLSAARAAQSGARLGGYFDPGHRLASALGAALALPGDEPAWDVYLAYPRGARWGEGPPLPVFWMHQLGDVPPARAPPLDGEEMRARIEALYTGR
jgi:hypothetical protein